jgi:hypothetical protein
MKIVLSLLSAAAVGLLVAANHSASLIEAKTLLQKRRRVIWSVLIGAAGFFLVMSAVLLGVIDLALQYEAQGFVLWNAVLSVAAGFITIGALAFVVAKVVFPKPDLAQGLFGSMALGTGLQFIEQFRHLFEPAAPVARAQEAPRPAPSEAVEKREELRQRPHGDFTIEQQPSFVH